VSYLNDQYDGIDNEITGGLLKMDINTKPKIQNNIEELNNSKIIGMPSVIPKIKFKKTKPSNNIKFML